MFADVYLSSAIRALEEKIDATKDSVTSGSLQNFESYRAMTAKIIAYREAIEILRTTYSQYFERKTIVPGREDYGDEFRHQD